MADRKQLQLISPRAWEHSADRAALNTLRALPGFDEVVRKVAGALGERGVRHIFLANAVRVGPRQRPKLDALWDEVLTTLDWPPENPAVPGTRLLRPELYVTQTPMVNAGAVGFDRPFVILNSGTLALLDREEQRVVLAHELGHIMSGHATYRTLALILLWFGVRNLPFLAGVALMPFQLALLEWYRKSELSSDRAGLLGSQDPETSMRTFLKLAGGPAGEDDEISLEEFMAQAAAYETDETAWDTVLKLVGTAFRDHPFHTVRAAELQRWILSGAYQRILDGTYARRGADDAPLADDYVEAAGYYGKQARDTFEQLGGFLDRARTAFTDSFRKPPQ